MRIDGGRPSLYRWGLGGGGKGARILLKTNCAGLSLATGRFAELAAIGINGRGEAVLGDTVTLENGSIRLCVQMHYRS